MTAVLITSSILILVIAALRPILRGRFRPLAQYALWLMVAVRLVVPWEAAPSAYSALALLDRAEEPARVAQAIGQTTVPIPAMSFEDAIIQAYQEYGTPSGDGPLRMDPDEQVMDRAEELAHDLTLSELAAKYAKPVWLSGAAAMGLWFLLVNLRLRRKLKGAKRLAGVNCLLPVYVSGELPSPCLCGTFRPAIYVIPAALESPDRLRHVLAHELTHYRHWDHWWALVRCVCLCLYWFDPLVWWAAAMSRQDCELACDEGAIRCLGEEERIPYGRTLVAMIAAGRNPLLQTATTMTGGRRRVRERVKLIARRPKTAIALVLTAALVLGLTAGFTFTGAPEDVPEHDPTESLEPDVSLALPADTLQERLLDVPEELRDNVEARASETKFGVNDIAVVSYWWDVPAEWASEQDPWLLDVHREERDFVDVTGWPIDNDGRVREIIAQDEAYCYTIERPMNSRFEMADSEPFTAAYEAIRAFAERQVLATEGVEPFDLESYLAQTPKDGTEQDMVQAAADRLMASPSVELLLAIGIQDAPGQYMNYVWSTVPGRDYYASYLSSLPASFSWEEFDWGTTEDPHFPDPPSTSSYLSITSSDFSAYIRVWEDSDLVSVHDSEHGTSWYHAQYAYSENGQATTPFAFLRTWYDAVELDSLRTTSVSDRGQSHEDVVLEWIAGYMPYIRCAPGGSYTCTYMSPIGVTANQPNWISPQELDYWAESRGYDSADFGKTWFGFSFSLVFVPENENARQSLSVGNTADYPDEAPEGALIFSRVGHMELIDGNWVCEGVGTGW